MAPAMKHSDDVNEGYQPSELEDEILKELQEGRNDGEPWGFTTPNRIESALNTRTQYASNALGNLVRAGWVDKPERGFYKFVRDPREGDQ